MTNFVHEELLSITKSSSVNTDDTGPCTTRIFTAVINSAHL